MALLTISVIGVCVFAVTFYSRRRSPLPLGMTLREVVAQGHTPTAYAEDVVLSESNLGDVLTISHYKLPEEVPELPPSPIWVVIAKDTFCEMYIREEVADRKKFNLRAVHSRYELSRFSRNEFTLIRFSKDGTVSESFVAFPKVLELLPVQNSVPDPQ